MFTPTPYYLTTSYTPALSPHLQILLRCFTLPISILPHMLLPRILIRLKHRHLLTIHMLRHLVSLPFLERKPYTLMTVILVVCLIFVILYADKVTVHGFGV